VIARAAIAAFLLGLALPIVFGAGGATAFAAEDPRELEGRTLFAKGEYEAALDLYAKLFAEKSDPIYLRNIGRCNQKLRRPDRAIDAFREYLRRARKVKPAERQEVEGFIHEMEELRAQQAADAEHERERAASAAATASPPVAGGSRPGAKDEGATATTAHPERKTEGADTGPPPEPLRRIPAAPSPEIDETSARGAAPNPHQTGRFFLALAVGTGYGTASGTGELNPMHRVAQSGFAPAQLGHAAPEIGVFILPRLLLSAQLRLQYVSYVNGEHVANAGCSNNYCVPNQLTQAVFGRVAWLLGDGRVHVLAGVIVGGGNIRHAIVFNADKMCGPSSDTSCVDTIASGPFLFGPSLGMLVELGKTFNLVLAVNTEFGLPKQTLNIDVNAGIAIRL
jgi:tetratricopeptide (TPR) repeat protein